MPTKLQGVDLSHHNAATSAPLNVDFAIVRVSYGTPDGRVVSDLAAELHLERLAIGGPRVLAAYHYLATGPNAAEGEAQAQAFLARAADLEIRFGPLGLAVDSEPLRDRDSAGKRIPWDPVEHVRSIVMGWQVVLSASNRPCLAYGSREWWARLAMPWWFPLHVPFWAASPAPAPDPWPSIAVQQLREPVGGVDHDTFDGTAAQLRELLGLPTVPNALACPDAPR